MTCYNIASKQKFGQTPDDLTNKLGIVIPQFYKIYTGICNKV